MNNARRASSVSMISVKPFAKNTPNAQRCLFLKLINRSIHGAVFIDIFDNIWFEKIRVSNTKNNMQKCKIGSCSAFSTYLWCLLRHDEI